MPRPLSQDIRTRMVEAVENGASRNSTAKRFNVAVSSVIKLMQAYTATGSIAPKQMGGYRKAILSEHEDTVVALVKATPDATLDELTALLKKRKIAASRSSVNRFLAAIGLSFKKNPARQRAR